MSYLALYRKYRPNSFDEVYGQKYIVDIIKNSILNNRISHAYLFSGPRGTGKTTLAKLIAKVVNCSNLDGYTCCESCNSCKLINNRSNPDILEIDAASNNGVDEIRIIRDNVALMPSVSKYRVYIIDEVHMLSISAFNALLKTLEEPPAHVIFILATTELYKVPETIVSRCQCFEFERNSDDDVVKCLSNIVDKENLSVDSDVLDLIAKHSHGGLRDSINLLDKLCSCSSRVDSKLFYDVVGLVDEQIIVDIVNHIIDNDVKYVFDNLEKLEKNGKNLEIFIAQVMDFLKNCVINNSLFISKENLVVILEEFNNLSYNIRFSSNVLLSLEITILKISNKLKNGNSSFNDSDFVISNNKDSDNNSDSNIVNNSEEILVESEHMVNFDRVINNAFALADKNLKKDILSKWNGFYDYVHNKEFASIVSYFLDSNIQVVGEKDVIISAEYSSVVNNAAKNIAKLELLFNLVMGKFYNIAFILDDEWIKLRDKYISDMNRGIKYEYIDSDIKKSAIIDNDDDNSFSDISLSARDIFGSDIVEIK